MTETIAPEASSMNDYELVLADLDKQQEIVLSLWNAGLSHAGKPVAKMDWYYLRNPVAGPAVFLLRFRGEFVGVAALGCRRFVRSNVHFNAGFAFDFVLSPEHRGLFPAIFVQRRLLQHAAQYYPIVYGIPNQRSRSVMERAGFRAIGEKIRYVRIIRCARVLLRYLPNWLCRVICPIIDYTRHFSRIFPQFFAHNTYIAWQERADESFDALWQMQGKADRIIGVRDMTFLNWRFSDCPLYDYRFFVVRSTIDNMLIAYAVCRVESGNLRVDDYLSIPEEPSALRCLWRALASAAYRESYDTISTEYFCGPQCNAVPPTGFVMRDRAPVLVAETDATLRIAVMGAWHGTLADEDI